MMTKEWRSADPAHAGLLEALDAGEIPVPLAPTAENCSNCGGVGRHIYIGSDGKRHDMPCGACGGSGQKRN